LPALVFPDIFLFILIQQIEQVDVPPNLQIQIEIAESAAFTLAASRIGGTSLANPAQARNNGAPVRLRRQFLLHREEDNVRVFTGQLMQPPCKGAGFDEYHIVVYTTVWENGQELQAASRAGWAATRGNGEWSARAGYITLASGG